MTGWLLELFCVALGSCHLPLAGLPLAKFNKSTALLCARLSCSRNDDDDNTTESSRRMSRVDRANMRLAAVIYCLARATTKWQVERAEVAKISSVIVMRLHLLVALNSQPQQSSGWLAASNWLAIHVRRSCDSRQESCSPCNLATRTNCPAGIHHNALAGQAPIVASCSSAAAPTARHARLATI